MRRSEGNVPFSLAVKHLFRHLDEPRRLRNNPIVRQFFGDPATGSAGRTNDQAALELIRRLVLRAAEEQQQLGIDARDPERALRQYRIVTLSCLEGKPMTMVAQELGLSRQQCYRERADICYRIAQSIQARQHIAVPASPHVVDGFRFLLNSIEIRAHAGDVTGALAAYEALTDYVGPSQKIEPLCRYAVLLNEKADCQAAWSRYRAAECILTSTAVSVAGSTTDALRAQLDVARGELCWRSGALAAAGDCFAKAASRMEELHVNGDTGNEETHARALLCLGAIGAVHQIDFRKAFTYISRADAILRRGIMASSVLGAEIAIWLCRFRDCLVTDSQYWKPEQERLEMFTRAYERACSTGSLELAAASTMALARHYSEVGDGAKALQVAASCITLIENAQFASRENFALLIARSLLYTKNWGYVSVVLRSFPDLDDSIAGSHRGVLQLVQALYALRCGKYQQAWQLSSNTPNEIQGVLTGTARTELLLVMAEAGLGLGRRRAARSALEEALERTESIGSAWLFKEAYDIAAKVTGHERFQRRAVEVRRLLRA